MDCVGDSEGVGGGGEEVGGGFYGVFGGDAGAVEAGRGLDMGCVVSLCPKGAGSSIRWRGG